MIQLEHPLLLASASPARQRLLVQAAIPHGVRVSGIDEQSIHRNNPEELVEALAAAKAGAVQLKLAADGELDTWIGVLGCDSVLVFEGEVFGKPADADEAIARWQSMAGCWAELITGHCLLSEKEPKLWRGTVRTRILFAALQKHEIIRYVSTGEPLACAGGFALEGIGSLAVERIEGCVSNVIGLSMPLLRSWLTEMSNAQFQTAVAP